MTPQFTIPCFVKVTEAGEMKEIVDKLLEMGYLFGQHSYDTLDNIIITYPDIRNTFCVGSKEYYNDIDFKDRIDCGENTSLFLALARMREDTDEGQYFIHKRVYDLYICNGKKLSELMYRRATAEEIINHFKRL